MGLLKVVGKPLSWDEAAKHRSYVREHGVIQFLNTYARVKDVCCQELLWGDELEYGVFAVDNEARTIKLSCRGSELLAELNKREMSSLHRCEGCTWHPEYGAWMVEATPRMPFSGYAADLLRVERNMRLRRKRILSVLAPDEIAPTVTCLPTMGVGDFVAPAGPVPGPIANSAAIPDSVINPHPRFGALTANIRARRGSNVDIRVPLYHDSQTPEYESESQCRPRVNGVAAGKSPAAMNGHSSEHGAVAHSNGAGTTTASSSSSEAPVLTAAGTPAVHMDAMAFGMGCCCLQVTFQGRDIDESRFMYDQLAVLSPIMLALSAATPILKGRLVDTDVRWNVISASVDDRTPAELGEATAAVTPDPTLVGGGIRRVLKSRYDSISTYLHYCRRRSDNPMYVLERYNDIPCPVDPAAFNTLTQNGVDPALATHVAHLFTRDPLVIFERGVAEVNDEEETDHFENIQSTNWQTVRWKPPPPRTSPSDPNIGWRTEFRSMEVQLTDLENAAFTVFVVLVTRVILAFDLSLYMPLSKVDENMRRAHERGAATQQRFFWRMHMAPPDRGSVYGEEAAAAAAAAAAASLNGTANGNAGVDHDHNHSHDHEHDSCNQQDTGFEEMTIEEIMMGKGDYYPGLIPLVHAYLEHIGCDSETGSRVHEYMELLRKRASGELPTAATWMRDFVTSHSEYKQDSVVTPGIALDLMTACRDIGEGRRACAELLGDLAIRPVLPETGYDVLLNSNKVRLHV
eukprot:TRINITY_DN430_c0_g1_i4.p1 TRINITY_DN430_c0_g1~~TRINITY_DN430_c0_g1_i4.p1  ORF type:complete len:744 (-),score=235.02 TRINITY_DN430_c0_g1_i4:584-2815(-)